MSKYEVVVSNLGTVYSGDNGFIARSTYQTYAGQSKSGYGRALGESVALFKDAEIVSEFTGTLNSDDQQA